MEANRQDDEVAERRANRRLFTITCRLLAVFFPAASSFGG